MKLIIEWPDLIGKTTLVNKLISMGINAQDRELEKITKRFDFWRTTNDIVNDIVSFMNNTNDTILVFIIADNDNIFEIRRKKRLSEWGIIDEFDLEAEAWNHLYATVWYKLKKYLNDKFVMMTLSEVEDLSVFNNLCI